MVNLDVLIRSVLATGGISLSKSPEEYLDNEGLLGFLSGDSSSTQDASDRDRLFAAVDPNNRVPRPPVLDDLARLHQIIRSRRVTSILEFGVGFSTLVMADALKKNKDEYGDFVTKNLRLDDVFTLHTVDADSDFIERTKTFIPEDLKSDIEFNFSGVSMAVFNDRAVTMYDRLPNVSPDFIYLDAPDQFVPVGDVRGVSTRHSDRMPMSADILIFEHFLSPGTLILIDGRVANARFLKANFQRNWEYLDDVDGDVRTFELKERPLGKFNRAQIEFCLGSEWLVGVEADS